MQEKMDKFEKIWAHIDADPYNRKPVNELISILCSVSVDPNILKQWLIKISKTLTLGESQIDRIIELSKSDPSLVADLLIFKAQQYPRVDNYKKTLEAVSKERFENVFEEALDRIGYNIVGIDALWNVYFEKVYGTSTEDMNFSQDDYESVKRTFNRFLAIPHLTIDQTWSLYSSFISSSNGGNYDLEIEEIESGRKVFEASNKLVQECIGYEYKVANLQDSWYDYLVHLRRLYHREKLVGKKLCILKIIVSVFERSISQHGESYWVLFIKLLKSLTFKANEPVLSNINSTVNLYLRRFCSFKENSYVAWSTYLSNVSPGPSETHRVLRNHIYSLKFHETLELEQWKEVASQLLLHDIRGSDLDSSGEYQGILYEDCVMILEYALTKKDPAITLERWICDILAEHQQDVQEARAVVNKLVDSSPECHWAWLHAIGFEKRYGDKLKVTDVYQKASQNVVSMQWPEPLLRDWLLHEQLHGNADSYRFAEKCCSRAFEMVKKRTEQIEIATDDSADQYMLNQENVSKKRLLEDDTDNAFRKKVAEGQLDTGLDKPQRDRENLTVRVSNLPLNITQNDVAQFFNDCGEPREITLFRQPDETQATIEYSSENQVLAALTKTYKILSGREINVERLVNNTIFVTNFSPNETLESMKEVFGRFGSIASIRFPSLKFNVDRRFCYIEYLDPEHALKAVQQLNGLQLRDDFKHNLSVKISNPKAKMTRSNNATEDGREVYIKNLDFKKTTAEKVQSLFEKYGIVQRVHLPLSMKSKASGRLHDGYGFVVFENAQDARKSLELNMLNLEGRIIEVSIAESQSTRKVKKVIQNTESTESRPNVEEIKNRIISILNVPDTVNANQLLQFLTSKVGPVVKVDLRSINNCALVEFAKVDDAGRAGLILNGESLNDSIISVGTRADFDKLQHKKSQPPSLSKPRTNLMVPTFARKKQRKGLGGGSKNSGKAATHTVLNNAEQSQNPETAQAKTNDDFRKLFLK